MLAIFRTKKISLMHAYFWYVTSVGMHAVINAQGPPVKIALLNAKTGTYRPSGLLLLVFCAFFLMMWGGRKKRTLQNTHIN